MFLKAGESSCYHFSVVGLRVRLIERVESADGTQAIVALIEPNDDEHQVRCLCRRDGSTEIAEVGEGEIISYLGDRYGEQVVWALCRATTL